MFPTLTAIHMDWHKHTYIVASVEQIAYTDVDFVIKINYTLVTYISFVSKYASVL